MKNIVTLIANPEKERLTQALANSIALKLDTQAHWIKEGVACELVVSGEWRVAEIENILTAHHSPLTTIDIIIQPAAHARKKLLICDMDSTMITVECIDELADFVGKKAEVAAITERAMNGELDFASALTERVALLKGLPEATLQQCYDERVKMMPGAKALVQAMRNNGAHCVLVSGGFTFFTARVAQELGFHEHYANVLEIENSKLTGRVVLPILGKEAKLAQLEAQCKKLGIGKDDVLAIGDGANDLPMLLAAGLGVAYHAKPVVRAQAKAQINYCDLSALIYALGL